MKLFICYSNSFNGDDSHIKTVELITADESKAKSYCENYEIVFDDFSNEVSQWASYQSVNLDQTIDTNLPDTYMDLYSTEYDEMNEKLKPKNDEPTIDINVSIQEAYERIKKFTCQSEKLFVEYSSKLDNIKYSKINTNIDIFMYDLIIVVPIYDDLNKDKLLVMYSSTTKKSLFYKINLKNYDKLFNGYYFDKSPKKYTLKYTSIQNVLTSDLPF